ncbi:DUF4332 domain-containing protein [Henriciella pelagia]|uniref:DUF4332 domain-containing protein n=1 Tax=Henriciella pelagia TaxID=1977912 RepID=A0ABQ1JQM4_9PROT|nr:DUF4332 domain-containing protein [Henriciella pelagia]GGB73068.1 hypothetical protein GCM10011503_22160 [Henriciella pelagia]
MTTSLLQNVIVAHRCRSTHHFIAMEALNHIDGPDADDWRNLLLAEHMWLLEGAKAPDTDFKDFKNHVLHVSEGNWGGAQDAATEWYGRAVEALRDRKWGYAAYALGVMSHYYSDPCQPFHTGQTEEEGSIHRAVEWSIAKSRDEIVRRIEAKGYPDVPAGDGPGFVADMVLAGAQRSHPHYQTFIDHYDIDVGAKNPPAGLDDTMLDAIADLCAYATKGIATLYVRAIKEAKVKPRKVNLKLRGYLATLDIPIRWVTKKMDNAADRAIVTKMYKELQETGKVIKSLPDDDKAIRKVHARDVLRMPIEKLDALAPRPTGTKHTPRIIEPDVKQVEPAPMQEAVPVPEPVAAAPVEEAPLPEPAVDTVPEQEAETAPVADTEPEADETPAASRDPVIVSAASELTLDSDVVDAPSIGPKTAERLAKIGITTIADLLDANPMDSADALDTGYITPESFADWQDQARLKMALPSLRVHDVQILVGAGYRSLEAVANASASELLKASIAFVETPEARRIISGSSAPDAEEINSWIGMAKDVG